MGDGIEVDDRELRAWSKRLDALARKFPRIADEEMGKWARGMRATLKSTPYPPKRRGQKYVRTGQLANRWAVRGSNNRWAIVNRRAGSQYVVGDKQAWMHRNRWWKAANVIRRGLGKLRDAIRARIRREA